MKKCNIEQRNFQLIRSQKSYGASRFIEEKCCINETPNVRKCFYKIYSPKLATIIELKGNHAKFQYNYFLNYKTVNIV